MTAETIEHDLMYEAYCKLKDRFNVWGFLTDEEQKEFDYLQSILF